MKTTSIDLEDAEVAVHHTEDADITSRDVMYLNGIQRNNKLNDNSDINNPNCAHLTGQETWNLIFCFLAWACNVSIVTLVIGSSNNVFLSIGGRVSIASIPLGAFFLGSGLISCGITEPLFRLAGRRHGFIAGIAFGLLATVLGAISLLIKSQALNVISTFLFGTSNGIGYFIRFAVIENVPKEWESRAVTLVVSGGVIAAFAGPEAGHATRGLFGDDIVDNLYYMGVFVMTAVFSVANLVFIAVVKFKPLAEPEVSAVPKSFYDVHKILLVTRSFMVPMLCATMGWIIMVVPMSVLRIAMRDAGFTPRQSMLAIELHFCGMYAPGFITGNLIHRYGARLISFVGCIVSCLSIGVLISSKTEMNGSVSTWIIGMILLGVGWNFQFTGTTVWLDQAAKDVECTKGQVQSANDFLMFLISGAWILGASFVYDAGFWGNSVLRGWVTLNFCVIAFLVIDFFIIVTDYYFQGLTPTGKKIEEFAPEYSTDKHNSGEQQL